MKKLVTLIDIKPDSDIEAVLDQIMAEQDEYLAGRKDSVEKGSFSADIEITKSDDRENLVFGWANVTIEKGNQVVDHQGHMIDVEDLESAAYNFTVKYRKTGDEHAGEGFGDLVESLIVTQEKIEKAGFPQEMLGKWWIGFRVPPEDWDRVEQGERNMFSIQGRAQLEAV